MKGHPTGRAPQLHQGFRPAKPPAPKSRRIIVIVGVSLVMMLVLGGVAAAWITLGPHKTGGDAFPAAADALGAMTDSELELLVERVNSRLVDPALEVAIPDSIESAANILAKTGSHVQAGDLDLHRLVVAEWLYGREVSEPDRDVVARAIANAYNEVTTEECRLPLIRAFRRWGNANNVHLFFAEKIPENVVPDILDLIRAYPTQSAAATVVSYLSSAHGDAAENILCAMEPEHARLLVPHYDSSNTTAVARARKIFKAWQVDIDAVRLDYYLDKAIGGQDEVWEAIASIPFRQDLQAQVIDGLRRYKREKLSFDDWLDACIVWGNPSILPLIHEVYTGNFAFNRDKALQFIAKYPDASSVPVLVDRLVNSWQSESEQIAEALLKLHRSSLPIDFVEQVHKPIVLRYNDFGMFQQPALKNVLETTNFDPGLLLDQCLRDLRSDDKSSIAFATLGRMEVNEDRRFEVAKTIEEIIRGGGIPGFHTDEAFLHWATAENTYLYDILNNERFGGDNWRTALRIALTGEGNENKFIVPVARALGDFFKGDEILDVLTQQGEAIEPLMITILQSNNANEVIGACQVLQVVGTVRCIPPLKVVLRKAKSLKNEQVFNAVTMAGQVITNRVGEDKIKEYEQQLKAQANDNKPEEKPEETGFDDK
jgi:hypothetical protein